MKIESIFAPTLFSFQYENEANELNRLLELWRDVSYLWEFVQTNKKDVPPNKSVKDLVFEMIEDANEIEDILHTLSTKKDQQLEQFFQPLRNEEYKAVMLSRQKGRRNYLRIYALKIDVNCYVITGGAIKFTQSMQEREHTMAELVKLERCKAFLKENGVLDTDSFYEFLNEDTL